MINKKILLIIFFFVGIWSSMSQQQQEIGKSENLALDPAVRYGKLDNGFTYYLRKNNSPANTIELHMIVKAGTYHEDEDQLEYAHLLEHMGGKGTKHFPDLDDYFHTSGRYSNAHTSYDHTRYYARIPSGDKQVLKAGLQVVRDWAQDILLEQESVDVERGAVLGEMRTSNPHRNWQFDVIDEQVEKNSGYWLPSPQRYKASIENFNREAFLRFYKDWYRPDLQAAIIVGDINVDSIESKIQTLFSDLKMSPNAKNAQERVDNQTVRLKGENQYVEVLDTIHPAFRVNIISKRINREFRPKNRDDFRGLLLQRLYREIADSRSNRLEQQYDPPFSSFTTNYHASTMAGGQLSATLMEVNFKSDDLREMKKEFVAGLIAWKQIHRGWTDTELDKAKDQLREIYFSPAPVSSADLAEKYTDHFVGGAAAPHPEVEQAMISELLEEIDLKEVQEFARQHSDLKKNTDYLFFTGGDDTVPKKELIKQWVAMVDSMEVKPLQIPKPAIVSLDDVADIPVEKGVWVGGISKNLIGVSTIQLKNGIKLILKPTEPRSESFDNAVSIRAFQPNPISFENREEYVTAKISPEVVQFSGAGPYTKFEIERFMQERGISLKFQTNKDAQMIYGKSNTTNIEELLNLLYLYTDQPRKDPEAFAAWKADKEEQFNREIRGNSEFYMDEVRALWFPQVPKLKKQDLDLLTMEKAFKAFDKWFTDFKDYTFIVTGDFDEKLIAPLLVKKLSAFPVGDQPSLDAGSKLKFPLKKMDEIIRLKNIDQAFVRMYFPVKVHKDLKTHTELELLSKALDNVAPNRLRAGSYSPVAGGEWVDEKNGVYSFWILFDSALGNEEKMIRNAIEEFRKLRENGVDQSWLEKAVTDEKAAFGRRLESFGYFNFWPEYLQKKLENGEDPEKEVLQYKTVLEHFISLEDLNAAAQKYMSEENLQQFLVLPEGFNK